METSKSIYSSRFEQRMSTTDTRYRSSHYQEWYDGAKGQVNFVPLTLANMFCEHIRVAIENGAKVDYSYRHGAPAEQFRAGLMVVAQEWLADQAVVEGTAAALVSRFASQW